MKMCYLCDENENGYESCQQCGRMICFDNKPNNIDVVDRAYVTASGDLYCYRCGSSHDQEEEDFEDEDGYDPYFDNWYDADMDFENEESNGIDIGPGSEQNGIAF